MKKYLFFLALAAISITVKHCQKEIPDEPLSVKDISVSACKLNGELARVFEPEYIILKATGDYFMIFNHVNSIFNCDPGQITVSSGISSGTIFIDEKEAKKGMHCVCPYDITFTLGPLQYGTYLIHFQKEGVTFKEVMMDFNKYAIIRIDI